MGETGRRRQLQVAFNTANGIVPRGVVKSVDEVRFITRVADAREEKDGKVRKVAEAKATYSASELDEMITRLEQDMRVAAEELDFEAAARLRDEVFELRARRDSANVSRKRDAFADIRASR
jgi:excinuclease ABC subunit B